MKLLLIFAVFALLGGAQCFRIRRQALESAPVAVPAAPEAPAAPVDLAAVVPAAPEASAAAVPGAPEPAADVAVPAAPEAFAPAEGPGLPAPAPTPKAAGLNVALGFMVDELDKQTALGGPVNPGGLQKACIVALKIKMLGGEVDKPTQDKLDALMADYALQVASPAKMSAFAAPPAAFM